MSFFSKRQWFLALVIAALVHVGVAFFVLRLPPDAGTFASGAGGVNVSLGPAGRAPGSIEPVPPPTANETAEPLEEPDEVMPDERSLEKPSPEDADTADVSEEEVSAAEVIDAITPETLEEVRPQNLEEAEADEPEATEPELQETVETPADEAEAIDAIIPGTLEEVRPQNLEEAEADEPEATEPELQEAVETPADEAEDIDVTASDTMDDLAAQDLEDIEAVELEAIEPERQRTAEAFIDDAADQLPDPLAPGAPDEIVSQKSAEVAARAAEPIAETSESSQAPVVRPPDVTEMVEPDEVATTTLLDEAITEPAELPIIPERDTEEIRPIPPSVVVPVEQALVEAEIAPTQDVNEVLEADEVVPNSAEAIENAPNAVQPREADEITLPEPVSTLSIQEAPAVLTPVEESVPPQDVVPENADEVLRELSQSPVAEVMPDDVAVRSPDLAPVRTTVLPPPRKPTPPQLEPSELPRDEPANEPAQVAGAGGEAGSQDEGDLGSGESDSGGGAAGARADYFALLQAWLEQHKVYPRRALSRRLEGVVSLRFVMNRQGQVLNYQIEQSSGHRLLDRAVETLIERAQPLPTMPDELDDTKLTLVVPISFVLN